MSELFLVRTWRGNAPLWRVYWLYGVLGSIVLSALIAIPEFSGWMTLPLLAAALLAGAVYTGWIVIGIWRCSFNIATDPLRIERTTWSMLARALTVAWAINVLGLSALLIASHLDR